MDEVVKSVDALSRQQFRALLTSLGLAGTQVHRLPRVLPSALQHGTCGSQSAACGRVLQSVKGGCESNLYMSGGTPASASTSDDG